MVDWRQRQLAEPGVFQRRGILGLGNQAEHDRACPLLLWLWLWLRLGKNRANGMGQMSASNNGQWCRRRIGRRDAIEQGDNGDGGGESNGPLRGRAGASGNSALPQRGLHNDLLTGDGRRFSLLLVVGVRIAGAHPGDSAVSIAVVLGEERNKIVDSTGLDRGGKDRRIDEVLGAVRLRGDNQQGRKGVCHDGR